VGLDAVMEEGHGQLAPLHHHPVWILLDSTHLLLELLQGGLLDHPGVGWADTGARGGGWFSLNRL